METLPLRHFCQLCLDEAQNKLKVLRSIKITIPSDLNALSQVLVQFNQIHQDFIPQRDWLQCRIAVAEGFTNAVKHAHKNLSTDTLIHIEVMLNEAAMEIRVWDYGAPFDLHNYIAETSHQNQDWIASGRGIPILTKISDRLEYRRLENQRNCLVIVKKFANL